MLTGHGSVFLWWLYNTLCSGTSIFVYDVVFSRSGSMVHYVYS